jgi:hypothetical protein
VRQGERQRRRRLKDVQLPQLRPLRQLRQQRQRKLLQQLLRNGNELLARGTRGNTYRKKESKKTKATKVHNTSSDSGDIESADDDSCFEPTDGAEDEADDDDDDDQADDDDNNDEGAEIDSYVSANSYLDDDPLASPEEGRHGAREATEESRHSAQAGAVNPLRTSNSEEHGTPPPPPARADSREIVGRMPLEAPTAQKNVVRRIVLFVKNTLFRQIKFVTSTKSFNEAFQKVLAEERPRNPYIFQLTYQNSFKTALNQKRSTCELSGKKIVVKAINTVFKNREEEFFTFDEFCKLRRATTERERKAFLCSSTAFWSVFAGLPHGIMRKQSSSFRRQETPVDQKLSV